MGDCFLVDPRGTAPSRTRGGLLPRGPLWGIVSPRIPVGDCSPTDPWGTAPPWTRGGLLPYGPVGDCSPTDPCGGLLPHGSHSPTDPWGTAHPWTRGGLLPHRPVGDCSPMDPWGTAPPWTREGLLPHVPDGTAPPRTRGGLLPHTRHPLHPTAVHRGSLHKLTGNQLACSLMQAHDECNTSHGAKIDPGVAALPYPTHRLCTESQLLTDVTVGLWWTSCCRVVGPPWLVSGEFIFYTYCFGSPNSDDRFHGMCVCKCVIIFLNIVFSPCCVRSTISLC